MSMPRRSTFTVKPFKNALGSMSWRVSGRIEGRRIRENFKTEAEAENKRLDYLRKAGAGRSDHNTVITWLSPEKVREAEAASQLLGGRSLTAAAHLYLKHSPAAANERLIQPLINDFLRQKATQNRAATTRDNLRKRLDHYTRKAHIKNLGDMTFANAKDWIFADNLKPLTQRSRRTVLIGFVNWLAAKPRQLLPRDFLEGLPVIAGEGAAPRRLLSVQVSALMNAAAADSYTNEATGATGRMLHNYVLRTFVGLRPSEVEELAVNPKGINLNEGYVFANKRAVKLEPNARAWLEYCRDNAPEIFFNPHVHNRVKIAAGLKKVWQPDICRHTYGSVHLRRYKDINRTVEDMGNSVNVVRRYYAVPMTDEERVAFDDLLPPGYRWKKIKGGRAASIINGSTL